MSIWYSVGRVTQSSELLIVLRLKLPLSLGILWEPRSLLKQHLVQHSNRLRTNDPRLRMTIWRDQLKFKTVHLPWALLFLHRSLCWLRSFGNYCSLGRAAQIMIWFPFYCPDSPIQRFDSQERNPEYWSESRYSWSFQCVSSSNAFLHAKLYCEQAVTVFRKRILGWLRPTDCPLETNSRIGLGSFHLRLSHVQLFKGYCEEQSWDP